MAKEQLKPGRTPAGLTTDPEICDTLEELLYEEAVIRSRVYADSIGIKIRIETSQLADTAKVLADLKLI